MKNPRSDPAPGASSSQGSGEAFARIQGRDAAGVRAWTGEKKTKFQTTPTPMDLDKTARRDDSEQADKQIVHVIDHHEREQGVGQIEGFDWDDEMVKEDLDSYFKRYHGLPDNDDDEAWAPMDDQQLKEMELRFAIYRIKAHKVPILLLWKYQKTLYNSYFLHILAYTDLSSV